MPTTGERSHYGSAREFDVHLRQRKKSAMTQEQLVQVMAYYLRRISPVNRKINGKILTKDGAGE